MPPKIHFDHVSKKMTFERGCRCWKLCTKYDTCVIVKPMDKCVCVCVFELVSMNTGRFKRNRWNEEVLLLGKYTSMDSDPEVIINKKKFKKISYHIITSPLFGRPCLFKTRRRLNTGTSYVLLVLFILSSRYNFTISFGFECDYRLYSKNNQIVFT